MEDVLTKATADGVRIYALCTTNLVRDSSKARLLPSRQCRLGPHHERRTAPSSHNEGWRAHQPASEGRWPLG